MNNLMPMLVVAAVVMASMAVFLLFRNILDWIRGKSDADNADAPALLVADVLSAEKKDWSERFDQSFEGFVRETGTGWSTTQVLAMIALAAVAAASFFYVWQEEFFLAAMAMLLAAAGTLGVFMVLRIRWRRGMQAQLPDVFYLLARSLRAGESLEQAMETVAEHGAEPLAEEFRRGADKLKLGLSVAATLRGMARRVNLPDFDIFVAAVTLHRTVGGNLSLLLDRVAASTRDRNAFRGYVLAATALSRITGFFIAAAAPVLFAGYLYLKPDFVTVFLQSATGMRALWAAIILEITGIIWLNYLLRIDY